MMSLRTPSFAIALSKLLPECAGASTAVCTVSGLSADSRTVQPGDLFLAVSGGRFDARRFLGQARVRGAVAAVVEEGEGWSGLSMVDGMPVMAVPGLRARIGDIASRFYGEPSRALRMTGVTGTNGKTTVTQLAARLATHLHDTAAVIGTLGWGQPGTLQETQHTTPDAIELQSMLSTLRDAGTRAVFMEVSSHALDQSRVAGVHFETAVLTNLTRDHLDYHGDMLSYAQAKARLFGWPGLRHAVINADDPFGRELLGRPGGAVQHLSYGLDDAQADVRASHVHATERGMVARIHTPWGEGELETRLLGRFNVANALAVLSVLALQGHGLAGILDGFRVMSPVKGRLECVAVHNGITVVVDYAHTPDALQQALATLREHTAGRLHVVFGCGGDRDAGKRPLMGRIAESSANTVWLTNDNPRHEDPATILAAIVGGMHEPARAHVVTDRAEAIHAALSAAEPGDTVLVAGKGHESWQQIGDEKRPFSDHAAVHAWLRGQGAAS